MAKRLLLRLRRSLRQLDPRYVREPEPADRDWHSMLARINGNDRELRLRDLERALNRIGR